jgi:transposase
MVALLKSSLMLEGSGSSAEDVTEGARRATVETSSRASPPDPEVEPIARRRRFSGSEKRRLLAEADRCKANGQLGAFLRRERLYSSMLASWRKQVGKAEQVALAPKKRGPKPKLEARQIQQLNRDNARLRRELERAKLIIDAQKNVWSAPRSSKGFLTECTKPRHAQMYPACFWSFSRAPGLDGSRAHRSSKTLRP